jgi:hypothetical protein
MEMQNQNWDVKNNLLFEENKGVHLSLIERIKFFYKIRIYNKTKLYYYKIKSAMEEPMFPY